MLNLRKAIRQKVINEGESKPFLISIGERAEAAIEAYENRQSGTQETLAEFMKFAKEYASAARESNQMGLDNNTFAIYRELKNYIDDVTPVQAQSVNQIFEKYPDHQWDDHQGKELRSMLYKTLSPTVATNDLIETTNKLLKLKRV